LLKMEIKAYLSKITNLFLIETQIL